jgi:hypothetical protein
MKAILAELVGRGRGGNLVRSNKDVDKNQHVLGECRNRTCNSNTFAKGTFRPLCVLEPSEAIHHRKAEREKIRATK